MLIPSHSLRARHVSELQKAKGFKGVIAATRKTTPGTSIHIRVILDNRLKFHPWQASVSLRNTAC